MRPKGYNKATMTGDLDNANAVALTAAAATYRRNAASGACRWEKSED